MRIVNPCGVVGPHDYKPSSVGKTILDFANRKMPAYVAGRSSSWRCRTSSPGHLSAMEQGRRGERYILSGGQHTLDEILDHLSALHGADASRACASPSA